MSEPEKIQWDERRWFVVASFLAIIIGAIWAVNSTKRMDSSKGKGITAFEGRDAPELPGIPVNAPPPRYLSQILAPSMAVAPGAVTGAVTLEWTDNPEPDIAGYRVYHGPDTNNYTNQVPVTSTMVTVAGLPPGVTRFFAVTATNIAGIESPLSEELAYPVPGDTTPSPDPTVTPFPTATVAPTPTPSPRPNPTASPTPGINASPPSVNFVWVTGRPIPTPFPIVVTTSNGANWTSQDSSDWFNTSPDNNGASGKKCIPKPHAWSSYPPENITLKSTGLPNTVVRVTMTRITPTPSPTPRPFPTATASPRPLPTPTCTPCECPN